MGSEKSEGESNLSFRSEIEKVKSDMDRAISELRGEIEGLKNTLIEIKSSLNELENPFNILSSIVDKEDFKRITGEVQANVAEREKVEPEKTMKPAEGGEGKLKEAWPLNAKAPETDYNMSIALIKWVWTLLDLGFEVDDVEKISKYCEFFRLLPKGSSQYISAIASAIDKAKVLNLSEDMMALSIYGAAKASGAKIDLEDMTDIVFNALRKLISRPS